MKKSVKKLGKAMRVAADGWTRSVDNKMRGAYGETDLAKKHIRINKKISKNRPMYKRPVNKGASKYPDVLGTIVHEEYHKNHPKATERTVRTKERSIVKNLTSKQKHEVYGKYR